jgi:hypothetical protein
VRVCTERRSARVYRAQKCAHVFCVCVQSVVLPPELVAAACAWATCCMSTPVAMLDEFQLVATRLQDSLRRRDATASKLCMQEVQLRLIARYEAQAALGYTACDATRVRDACTSGTAACIFSYDMVPYVVAMYDDDGRMCGTGTVVRSGDGDDWLVLTSSAAVGGGGGGSVRFFVEQGVAACDHIEMKLDDGAAYRFGPEAVMVR